MKRILFLFVFFITILISSQANAVKCCNWLYDEDWEDPYMYWEESGAPWTQYELCYGCGSYPLRCGHYYCQNGHWGINVAQVYSCSSSCPLLKTCDTAAYQACDLQGIDVGVTRMINVGPYANPPCTYYQCTISDRWKKWEISRCCNNLG